MFYPIFFIFKIIYLSCKLLPFSSLNKSDVDDDGDDEESDSNWSILIDYCKHHTDAMRFLRSTTDGSSFFT